MGQTCANMPCGWTCFFNDVNKMKSNKIDKDLNKEKLYYKRQGDCTNLPGLTPAAVANNTQDPQNNPLYEGLQM
ncbi:unnamed protein product [Clavelina lepadiformis]|uniref:Uncharacterized protein n=1 Tax=Clavelina lepadiformis TaxID=159417 RepID=A0ABP0GX92_CLALP